MAWGPSNLVSSGSIRDSDAILRVQAPAGSTVTISKGTIVRTDSGHCNQIDPNTYDYYFVIREVYFDSNVPWVVHAELNGADAERNIYITDAYEYNVIMSYRLYLVQNGQKLVTFSGNTIIEANADYNARAPEESTSGGYLTLTQPRNNPKRRSGSFATSNIIDISEYNVLKLEYDVAPNTAGAAYGFVVLLYVHSQPGSSPTLPSYQTSATAYQSLTYTGTTQVTGQTLTINLSTLSPRISNALIGIGLNCHNQDVGGTVTVNNLYLNP